MGLGIGLSIGIGIGSGGSPVAPPPTLWLKYAASGAFFQDSGGTVPSVSQHDTVGCWKDISGNGNHCILLNPSNPAFLEKNAFGGVVGGAYFDGVQSLLAIPAAVGFNPANVTIFARLISLSIGNNRGILGSGNANYGYNFAVTPYTFITNYATWNFYFAGSPVTVSPVVTLGSNGTPYPPHIICLQPSQFLLNDNGTVITGSPQSSEAYTGGVIGDINPEGLFSAGQFYLQELIVYDQVLSATQISNLLAYMNGSYPTLTSYFDTSVPLVVFHGNSLTAATGATPSTGFPAITYLGLAQPWNYCTVGQPGYTDEQCLTQAPYQVDVLFSGSRTKNVCVFWEITNAITNGDSAATIYANYQTYGNARISAGAQVMILLDCMDRGTFTSPELAVQSAINADLASDFNVATGNPYVFKAKSGVTYANILIKISQIPATQNTASATYFAGDGIHLSQAGYAAIAPAVTYAIQLATSTLPVQMSLFPTSAQADTTVAVTATGVNTSWTTGTTFSATGVSGVTITGISVNATTQVAAFSIVSSSASTGVVTITDSTDAAVANFDVTPFGPLQLTDLALFLQAGKYYSNYQQWQTYNQQSLAATTAGQSVGTWLEQKTGGIAIPTRQPNSLGSLVQTGTSGEYMMQGLYAGAMTLPSGAVTELSGQFTAYGVAYIAVAGNSLVALGSTSTNANLSINYNGAYVNIQGDGASGELYAGVTHSGFAAFRFRRDASNKVWFRWGTSAEIDLGSNTDTFTFNCIGYSVEQPSNATSQLGMVALASTDIATNESAQDAAIVTYIQAQFPDAAVW